MSDLPVFIDGPLKGRADVPVDAFTRGNGMRYGPSPDDMVRYLFSDVAMFHHTVLIGSVAQPPSSEAMFEVLCSDAAKASALYQGYPGSSPGPSKISDSSA